MSRQLFVGAKIWDASGAQPFEGDVLVEGNRISAISKGARLPQDGCDLIKAKGRFLMPGMTEGHAHLSFDNVTTVEDLIAPPPEEHTMLTARVAERLLDQGFTSAWGASEAKMRLGVAVRNEVNAGRWKGPRIRAGSIEITVTGGMGDENRLHSAREGLAIIVDGADEMRKAVRLCIRSGCDNVKLDVSGDSFYPNAPAHSTPMMYDEIRMAVETARCFGRPVNAHTRSIEGTQHCLRAGVDVLYHCEFSDEKTLDMFEEAKDRIFVAPTVSLLHTLLYEAEPMVSAEMARGLSMDRLLESSQATHSALRKRGIRHVIGGDYGFSWSHNGTNARDVEFLIKYFGYSPAEALICATRNGGDMMCMDGSDRLGQIKEGYLADLLLVDGDPLKDPRVLVDANRLVVIMKDGAIHKNTTTEKLRD